MSGIVCKIVYVMHRGAADHLAISRIALIAGAQAQ
ncbi:hypothetical protein V1288_005715 [Bradyrhizobium sp. AZCC 2176]